MFKIKYSQDKDIMNYLNSLWNFSYRKYGRKNVSDRLLSFFPDDFQVDIRKAKTRDEAVSVVKKYLQSLSGKFINQLPIIEIGLEKIFNDQEQEIINLLESVYKAPFPFKEITIYLTTVGIFPYNFDERWFMSHYADNIEGHLKTAKHELNHFMFYYYYREKLRKMGLSESRIEDIKEALVVFTNPEGSRKPSVKKIETFLKSQKETDIFSLIKLILDRV